MAAVFSSASGGFITGDEWKDAVKDYSVYVPLTVPLYLGGDFAGEDTRGRDVDENVLIGVIGIKEDKKDMIQLAYANSWFKTKKEIIYDDIKRFPNTAKFAYDKVGVGDSVKNDLIEKNILAEYQIESLTYSLPNKSEVYYNLKHLFEQRKIRVPNIPKLKEQLLGLRFEKTEGGYIKVHHKSEGLHDDYADALANACYAARILKGIPVEVTFIPHPQNIKSTEKKQNKGDLIFCLQCNDYHWTSQPHKDMEVFT